MNKIRMLVAVFSLGLSQQVQAGEISAAKVNLRVFATGDLPNEGWFILQAVEGDKPLLEPKEKDKRGDLVWFAQSAEKPLYQASVQVQDTTKFNLSFVQIENTDNRLVKHVVV